MTSDGQYDADELLSALQQIESICSARKSCKGCIFSEKKSERNVCRFVDSPYTWDFLSIEKLEGGDYMDGRLVSQSRRLLLALLDVMDYFGFENAYKRVLNDMSEFLLAGIVTETYMHYYRIGEGDCKFIYALCVVLYGDYATSPVVGWFDYDGVRKAVAFLNILLAECKKGG